MNVKRSLLYSALVAGVTGLASLSTPALAQDGLEAAESAAETASDDRRDRRRRTGRSNRNEEYSREIVDETAPGGIREEKVEKRSGPGAGRNVLPRKYRNIPRPQADQYVDAVPIPDRWRIMDNFYPGNLWDPYNNQNLIKGDVPLHDDWFVNVIAISDTVLEFRQVPTPVGVQSTRDPGSLDVLGATEQVTFNQNFPIEFVYYKGNTVFKPPDWEFRFTPVFNYNYTELEEITGVNANPDDEARRHDDHVGIQTLFVDKHLRNVSHRYDFDSLRVGIQPFSSDFRGFLFQDVPFGVRLFGTRDNNIFQYNLAWFRRLEKDTNSGLNDVTEDLRDDDVFIANVFWQDLGIKGFFSQGTIAYNRNREDSIFYDSNNFIQRPASIGQERPRTYDVYYLGYNGDGHIGRLNLTVSAYLALGEENNGVFNGENSDIEAFFFAAEPGIDFDWIRLRGSFLYGSGDDDPFDNKSTGFDAIFENPQFAGADTSYWIRQGVPLIGGGRVALQQRNGVLNSLESSKEHGQSNFTNPGVILVGGGVDLDILPEFRLSFNANYLAFAETEVLEVARAQSNVDEEIGYDLSAAIIWRPFMSQNIVVRLSYAQLIAGDGFQDLYGDEDDPYSILLNTTLTF